MKLQVTAFAISFTIVLTVIIGIISIWARTSSTFGKEFMDVFNSLHPHPFKATVSILSWKEHAFGIALDIFYILADSLIFSLSTASLYNWIAGRSKQNSN